MYCDVIDNKVKHAINKKLMTVIRQCRKLSAPLRQWPPTAYEVWSYRLFRKSVFFLQTTQMVLVDWTFTGGLERTINIWRAHCNYYTTVQHLALYR